MDNEIQASKLHFALDLVSIARMQLNDPYCAPIINTINIRKNFNYESILLHDNNKMLRSSDNKVVIPLCLQSRIIEFYHEELCHSVTNRTLENIVNNLFWTSMTSDVEYFVSQCDVCARLK